MLRLLYWTVLCFCLACGPGGIPDISDECADAGLGLQGDAAKIYDLGLNAGGLMGTGHDDAKARTRPAHSSCVSTIQG